MTAAQAVPDPDDAAPEVVPLRYGLCAVYTRREKSAPPPEWKEGEPPPWGPTGLPAWYEPTLPEDSGRPW